MNVSLTDYMHRDLLANVSSSPNKSPLHNKGTSFQQQLDACLESSMPASNAKSLNKLPDAASNSIDAMLLAQSTGKSFSETTVIKEIDWLDQKPEDYSMDQFKASIAYANYAQSLQNPEVLPRWVTKPEAGISRSTDMVSPPSFEEGLGGVYRIDHTMSGKVLSFIPSYEWRKTTSSKNDAVLGDVYSQQTPWGFRTVSIRDGSGRTPAGYKAGAYEKEIAAIMDRQIPSEPSRTAAVMNQVGPTAELSWQERLVFYNNPARYLLGYRSDSQSDGTKSNRNS